MSANKKAKPVDRAMPVIRKPMGKDAEKISVTRTTTTAMQGSPAWSSTPAIQTASVAWNKAADKLEAQAKAIGDLRSKLSVLLADMRGLRRDWTLSTQQMLSTVAVNAGTSADDVHALGFEVRTHVPVGVLPAPTHITTLPGKAAGEVVVSWFRGSARHGFVVQHATDVANVATQSEPTPCTKTKYTLKGAQAPSTVYFRVAAIDPSATTGRSPWSDWVAGSVLR